MKKLLFILLLTIPFIGFGQERYHVDEVTSPNDTLTYLKFDMSLVNGIVYSDLGELGHYNKGKKNGLWKELSYRSNEKGWCNTNYKDGMILSFKCYWENDMLIEEYDGEKRFYRRWYENGTLRKEILYSEIMIWDKTKMSGLYRTWYDNGQLEYIYNVKDGGTDGPYKSYYKNGQLEEEKNYINNKKEGIWKYYYEDGQLRKKENYKNGMNDGISEYYHKNGQLMWKNKYKDGKIEVNECWDENGNRENCD